MNIVSSNIYGNAVFGRFDFGGITFFTAKGTDCNQLK